MTSVDTASKEVRAAARAADLLEHPDGCELLVKLVMQEYGDGLTKRAHADLIEPLPIASTFKARAICPFDCREGG